MPKLIALIMFLSLGIPAHSAFHNALVFNVGTVVFGNYELGYERKISDQFSVATIATYYDSRQVLVRVFSLGYVVGTGLALKFHPWGDALRHSVYLSPYLKLGFLVHPEKDGRPADHNILARTGIAFGWAYAFDFGLALDINWSLENYQFLSLDKSPSQFQAPQGTMFRPSFLIGLGYSW